MTEGIDVKGAPLAIENRRQLFLDDRVIERTQGLERVQAAPVKHPANPVVRRDRPWDAERCELSGSAVWDPDRKKFRLFYNATGKLYAEGTYQGSRDRDSCLALAESGDGVAWTKPTFDLFPYDRISRTGIVLGMWNGLDWIHGPAVFRDEHDPDPARRYKLFTDIAKAIRVSFSPDGVHWTPSKMNPVIGHHSDTGNCPFWDPIRKTSMAYVRMRDNGYRCVGRTDSPDFETWSPIRIVYRPRQEERARAWHYYQHSVTPYQGLYVGLLHIFESTGKAMDPNADSPITWPVLTVSRDGAQWQRAFREDPGRPFLPTGEPGAWDSRMIRTASSLVVRPDRLFLLYSGSSNIHYRTSNWEIGLATLRVDGFVSLDAGAEEGSLLTKPLAFEAGRLRINAAVAPGGYVKGEVVGDNGRPVAGYGAADCRAFTGDSIEGDLTWDGHTAVPASVPKGTRLRFLLRNARLYSLWVE